MTPSADYHAHLWPARYLRSLTDQGHPKVRHLRQLPGTDTPDDLAQRHAVMDTLGIHQQFVSVGSLLPHTPSATHPPLISALNDELVTLPSWLSPLFSLPIPDLAGTHTELKRLTARHHPLNLHLTTRQTRTLACHRREWHPILERLDDAHALIAAHAAGHNRVIPAPGPDLTWTAGAVIEDTEAAAIWLIHDLPKRYPHIDIIFGRLGGALPHILARIAPESTKIPTNMWFDTANQPGHALLTFAASTYATNALLLGTDYPFLNSRDLTTQIKNLDGLKYGAKSAREHLDQNSTSLTAKRVDMTELAGHTPATTDQPLRGY